MGGSGGEKFLFLAKTPTKPQFALSSAAQRLHVEAATWTRQEIELTPSC